MFNKALFALTLICICFITSDVCLAELEEPTMAILLVKVVDPNEQAHEPSELLKAVLTNVETEVDYNLYRRDRLIYKEVPSGRYVIRQIHLNWANVAPFDFPVSEREIILSPSIVNYIGDIEVSINTSGVRHQFTVNFTVKLNPETLGSGLEKYSDDFRELGVQVSLPGQSPVPILPEAFGF
jgi:hypothetical protein